MDGRRRLRMQATPRGGNTTPRRRLPAFVVEFNKAIVLLLLLPLHAYYTGMPISCNGKGPAGGQEIILC
jgi:hypothetical protein